MKKAVLIAVAVALLGVLAVFFARSRTKETPMPNIDALAEVLKKSAAEKFAPPRLANERFELRAAPDKIEVRTKDVIDAAIQTGGTAVKVSGEDGHPDVLAQIPQQNAAMFYGLLGRERPAGEPGEENSMRLIEVAIRPE